MSKKKAYRNPLLLGSRSIKVVLVILKLLKATRHKIQPVVIFVVHVVQVNQCGTVHTHMWPASTFVWCSSSFLPFATLQFMFSFCKWETDVWLCCAPWGVSRTVLKLNIQLMERSHCLAAAAVPPPLWLHGFFKQFCMGCWKHMCGNSTAQAYFLAQIWAQVRKAFCFAKLPQHTVDF